MVVIWRSVFVFNVLEMKITAGYQDVAFKVWHGCLAANLGFEPVQLCSGVQSSCPLYHSDCC